LLIIKILIMPLVEIFLSAAFFIFLYQSAWTLIALWRKDNGLADIAWGLGFVGLAAVVIWRSGNHREWTLQVLFGMVAIWGLRLSMYLWLRSLTRKHEDFRYANWRKEWGRHWVWRTYLQVFLLQGLFMWIISLPIQLAAASAGPAWGIWQSLGLLLFVPGFLIETIADWQMMVFKKSPINKGKIMQIGLWSYSRHPNYFGETLCWWGIGVYTLGFSLGFWGLVGPLVITWLLLRVSGVPMLEEKYREDEQYQAYVKRTSAFVLWPPKA
jgi:steroid 5-alpha reductase family enzyme